MKIRDEIMRYASEDERPVLIWLFDHYHMSSTWPFVSYATFEKDDRAKWESRRIWHPNLEGKILFDNKERFGD